MLMDPRCILVDDGGVMPMRAILSAATPHSGGLLAGEVKGYQERFCGA